METLTVKTVVMPLLAKAVLIVPVPEHVQIIQVTALKTVETVRALVTLMEEEQMEHNEELTAGRI